MISEKKNIAIMISGRGSNMKALIDASHKDNYPARIVAVLSDHANSAGLGIACNYEIPTHFVERSEFASKQDHENEILEQLKPYSPDYICLAGYMRILSADFIRNYPGRILNIHPSLLPKYKGLNTHARALEGGEKVHGCSVHFVTPKMDEGQIIAQSQLKIATNDTIESLALRVIKVEHKLYPEAVKKVANGEVKYIQSI